MKHLVFFDGMCGFCDQIVQIILKIDKEERFVFAPLQGETAKQYLINIPNDTDSLVLIENYQLPSRRYFIYGKAAFRILWLLGFPWSAFGVISFLPAVLYNWAYRLVAKYRQTFFPSACIIIPSNERKRRFLD